MSYLDFDLFFYSRLGGNTVTNFEFILQKCFAYCCKIVDGGCLHGMTLPRRLGFGLQLGSKCVNEKIHDFHNVHGYYTQ